MKLGKREREGTRARQIGIDRRGTEVDVGAHLPKSWTVQKEKGTTSMYFDSSFILCSPQHEPNQLKIIPGTTAPACLWHVINFFFFFPLPSSPLPLLPLLLLLLLILYHPPTLVFSILFSSSLFLLVFSLGSVLSLSHTILLLFILPVFFFLPAFIYSIIFFFFSCLVPLSW